MPLPDVGDGHRTSARDPGWPGARSGRAEAVLSVVGEEALSEVQAGRDRPIRPLRAGDPGSTPGGMAASARAGPLPLVRSGTVSVIRTASPAGEEQEVPVVEGVGDAVGQGSCAVDRTPGRRPPECRLPHRGRLPTGLRRDRPQESAVSREGGEASVERARDPRAGGVLGDDGSVTLWKPEFLSSSPDPRSLLGPSHGGQDGQEGGLRIS